MIDSFDLLGMDVTTSGAGEGLDSLLGTGRSLGNRRSVAVAGSIDLLGIDVTTSGAGEGLDSLLGAGGSFGNRIRVAVAGSLDLLGIGIATSGAGEGLNTALGTSGRLGHCGGITVTENCNFLGVGITTLTGEGLDSLLGASGLQGDLGLVGMLVSKLKRINAEILSRDLNVLSTLGVYPNPSEGVMLTLVIDAHGSTNLRADGYGQTEGNGILQGDLFPAVNGGSDVISDAMYDDVIIRTLLKANALQHNVQHVVNILVVVLDNVSIKDVNVENSGAAMDDIIQNLLDLFIRDLEAFLGHNVLPNVLNLDLGHIHLLARALCNNDAGGIVGSPLHTASVGLKALNGVATDPGHKDHKNAVVRQNLDLIVDITGQDNIRRDIQNKVSSIRVIRTVIYVKRRSGSGGCIVAVPLPEGNGKDISVAHKGGQSIHRQLLQGFRSYVKALADLGRSIVIPVKIAVTGRILTVELRENDGLTVGVGLGRSRLLHNNAGSNLTARVLRGGCPKNIPTVGLQTGIRGISWVCANTGEACKAAGIADLVEEIAGESILFGNLNHKISAVIMICTVRRIQRSSGSGGSNISVPPEDLESPSIVATVSIGVDIINDELFQNIISDVKPLTPLINTLVNNGNRNAKSVLSQNDRLGSGLTGLSFGLGLGLGLGLGFRLGFGLGLRLGFGLSLGLGFGLGSLGLGLILRPVVKVNGIIAGTVIPIISLSDGIPLGLCAGVVNVGQTGATRESIITDGGHAVGDDDLGQTGAIRESVLTDGGHTVADRNGGQAGANVESIITDRGHAVGNDDLSQASAIVESTRTDGGHAVRDLDGGQSGATIESRRADGGYAVGDDDGGQAGAIAESIPTDGGHAVGDDHVRQALTTEERIGFDNANGIRDLDLRDKLTIQIQVCSITHGIRIIITK